MNNDITANSQKDYNVFLSFLSRLKKDEKSKSIHQLFLIIVCD